MNCQCALHMNLWCQLAKLWAPMPPTRATWGPWKKGQPTAKLWAGDA